MKNIYSLLVFSLLVLAVTPGKKDPPGIERSDQMELFIPTLDQVVPVIVHVATLQPVSMDLEVAILPREVAYTVDPVTTSYPEYEKKELRKTIDYKWMYDHPLRC